MPISYKQYGLDASGNETTSTVSSAVHDTSEQCACVHLCFVTGLCPHRMHKLNGLEHFSASNLVNQTVLLVAARYRKDESEYIDNLVTQAWGFTRYSGLQESYNGISLRPKVRYWFDLGYFLLLPEQHVLDEIHRASLGNRPLHYLCTNDAAKGVVFNYRLFPSQVMKRENITLPRVQLSSPLPVEPAQSDEQNLPQPKLQLELHAYPYTTLPILRTPASPVCVVFNAAEKLVARGPDYFATLDGMSDGDTAVLKKQLKSVLMIYETWSAILAKPTTWNTRMYFYKMEKSTAPVESADAQDAMELDDDIISNASPLSLPDIEGWGEDVREWTVEVPRWIGPPPSFYSAPPAVALGS